MRWWLILLILLPGASAATIDLEVPTDFALQTGVYLSGHMDWDTTWKDGVIIDPHWLDFDQGRLTVCEREARGASLLETLELAKRDCPGSTTYDIQNLSAPSGGRLRFLGEHTATAPTQGLATISGGLTPYIGVVPATVNAWAAPNGGFAFGAMTEATPLRAEVDGEEVWFNGTNQVFLHSGSGLRFRADAFGAEAPTSTSLLITPAADPRPTDPFRLLDVQDALLGSDAREPRSNVTGVFSEFGRTPHFINGAVLGRLTGTVGATTMSPSLPTLVRADSIVLQLRNDRVTGEADVAFTLNEKGLKVAGEFDATPPWVLVILLWIAAALVLIVRRHPPIRAWWQHLIPIGGLVLAAIIIDARVLEDIFGTSAWALWRGDSPAGPTLALMTLEVVILVMASVLIWGPLRIIGSKLSPDKWTWVGDTASLLLWLIIMWVAPTAMFALGYSVARL